MSRVPALHLDMLDKDDVKYQQRHDPTYGELIRFMEENPSSPLPWRLHIPTSEFYLENGLLFL